MADVLADALAWLTDQQKEHRAKTATLRRGSQGTANVTVAVGSQLLRVLDGRGNTKVDRTDADFLIAADEYVINGQAVQPEAGDLVEIAFGAVTKRFEVMPIASEPAWRWSDPVGQTLYRVHAKYRGTV